MDEEAPFRETLRRMVLEKIKSCQAGGARRLVRWLNSPGEDLAFAIAHSFVDVDRLPRGSGGTLDSFEALIATILRSQGYGVYPSFPSFISRDGGCLTCPDPKPEKRATDKLS